MRFAPWFAAALLLLHCEPDRRRPARLSSDCPDAASSCVDLPPVGVGGSSGADAARPPGDADARPETSIAGTVVLLDGDDFEALQPFVATAVVHAQAAAGGTVTGLYDGVSFALDGVLFSSLTWFAAQPEPGLDALTSLTAVDTTLPGDIVLQLARSSTLDLIYGVLAEPAVVESGRGHVVVRVVDAEHLEPLAGVTVGIAQAGVVAYASAGTWTGDAPGTGSDGLAVIGNLPAVPLPGSLHELVLSGPAGATLDVLVAADAITLLYVALGG